MFVFVREEMNLRENLVRQRDSCDIELGNSFIFSQNEHQIVLKSFLEMVLICRSDFKDSFQDISNLLLLIQCPFLYIFGRERSCLTLISKLFPVFRKEENQKISFKSTTLFPLLRTTLLTSLSDTYKQLFRRD